MPVVAGFAAQCSLSFWCGAMKPIAGRIPFSQLTGIITIIMWSVSNVASCAEPLERHPLFSDDALFASTRESGDPLFGSTQAAFITPVASPSPSRTGSEVLPDGLLYRSYIAAPNEPRFASIGSYDLSKKSWRWDATLGGRVGLFRQNQTQFLNLDVWQIDLEGAAMPRLNPHLQMDVESVDYRFGLLWTGKRDNVAFKFGYFHTSSHVGDEYLLENPTFERINFVRESLVLGSSVQATPEFRYYGEAAYAVSVSGGARPWQFQFGGEYAAIAERPTRGAPFSAINVQLREEVDYAAGITLMTGWQWKGPESGRTMRVGLQYYNGPPTQYEFFRRYDNQLGAGIWFDY